MATKLCALRFFSGLVPRKNIVQQQALRRLTTTSFGGVREQPTQNRFGLLKAVVVVVPFLYVGATISKEGAAFLEDYGYFVPDDDDDD